MTQQARDQHEPSSEPTGAPADRLHRKVQADRYSSPWSLGERVAMALWHVVWLLLFRRTPKPCRAWRRWLLRCFGCRMTGRPFVAASARIRIPWLLTLEDRACIGEAVEVYNLGPVAVRANAVVAQQVYLCAGTHDLENPDLPLVVGPIDIGREAFVGVRALVLPGVTIDSGAVIGGGAVVTKDMPAWTVCGGNPCQPIKPRKLRERQNQNETPDAASSDLAQ
jgi:putative colanic acid biosynthesis acetyltransferase WcaF